MVVILRSQARIYATSNRNAASEPPPGRDSLYIRSRAMAFRIVAILGSVLPGPVSVANVQKVFDADGRALDPKIEKAIRSVATNLIGYIQSNICPRFALEAMVRGAAE
jgi:hypothetical protein